MNFNFHRVSCLIGYRTSHTTTPLPPTLCQICAYVGCVLDSLEMLPRASKLWEAFRNVKFILIEIAQCSFSFEMKKDNVPSHDEEMTMPMTMMMMIKTMKNACIGFPHLNSISSEHTASVCWLFWRSTIELNQFTVASRAWLFAIFIFLFICFVAVDQIFTNIFHGIHHFPLCAFPSRFGAIVLLRHPRDCCFSCVHRVICVERASGNNQKRNEIYQKFAMWFFVLNFD